MTFSTGIIDCFINDGINSHRKVLTITKTNSSLKFEYDGKLSGNGCVSFGKVFSITLPKKLKISPKNLFLGNTVTIGGKVITEIENIVKSAGLDLNVENSFRNPTGTIVNSISNNIITCANTPINISTNDIIFNHNVKIKL